MEFYSRTPHGQSVMFLGALVQARSIGGGVTNCALPARFHSIEQAEAAIVQGEAQHQILKAYSTARTESAWKNWNVWRELARSARNRVVHLPDIEHPPHTLTPSIKIERVNPPPGHGGRAKDPVEQIDGQNQSADRVSWHVRTDLKVISERESVQIDGHLPAWHVQVRRPLDWWQKSDTMLLLCGHLPAPILNEDSQAQYVTMIDTRQTTAEEGHMILMQQALNKALSDDCVPVQTAFCVGCVLVARVPGVEAVTLATGYSRELPGNTHAEANALTKALSLSKSHLAALFPSASPTPSIEDLLRYTDVYTTLEPCSVRTSGLPACADTLIKAGVKRCIIGAGEPDDFVKCEGARKLRDAGVDVVWLSGLEKQCLDAARRGHDAKA